MSIFLGTTSKQENIVTNSTHCAPDSVQNKSRIYCKKCAYPITQPRFAISPKGRHQHLQCNPSGMVFIFSCFSTANGCFISGKPSSEFSWFKEFQWQFSSCQACAEHLGWYFSHSQ